MSLCKYLIDFYSEIVGNNMFLPIKPHVYKLLCKFNDTNLVTGIKYRYREPKSLLEYICIYHREIPNALELFEYLLKLDENLIPKNFYFLGNVLSTMNIKFLINLIESRHFTKDIFKISNEHITEMYNYLIPSVDALLILVNSGFNLNSSNCIFPDSFWYNYSFVNDINIINIQELIKLFNSKGFINIPDKILLLISARKTHYKTIHYLIDNYAINLTDKVYVNSLLNGIINWNTDESIIILNKLIAKGLILTDEIHEYCISVLLYDSEKKSFRVKLEIFKILIAGGLLNCNINKILQFNRQFYMNYINISLLKSILSILHPKLDSKTAIKFYTEVLKSIIFYKHNDSIIKMCIKYGAKVKRVCNYYKKKLPCFNKNQQKIIQAFITDYDNEK